MRGLSKVDGNGVKNIWPSSTPPSGYEYQRYRGMSVSLHASSIAEYLVGSLLTRSNKKRTTSQLKTKAGSPFSSASKVYPAGRVAGAVTWTMIGRASPPGFKGVLAADDAMVKEEREVMEPCFTEQGTREDVFNDSTSDTAHSKKRSRAGTCVIFIQSQLGDTKN